MRQSALTETKALLPMQMANNECCEYIEAILNGYSEVALRQPSVNTIIKRTPMEEQVVKMFEKDNVFSNMSE